MGETLLLDDVHTDGQPEVPSDGEVLEIVVGAQAITPTGLLNALIETGHTRANSQRAIQRCLERNSIKFDFTLKLVPTEAAA